MPERWKHRKRDENSLWLMCMAMEIDRRRSNVRWFRACIANFLIVSTWQDLDLDEHGNVVPGNLPHSRRA